MAVDGPERMSWFLLCRMPTFGALWSNWADDFATGNATLEVGHGFAAATLTRQPKSY